MRILDFQHFSKLYEAEELEGQTASTLRRIVNSFFMSYSSMSALTGGYDKMLQDLDSIKNAEVDEKIGKMRDAAKAVSSKVTEEFKSKGVNAEWEKAANKFTDALEALIVQYKGDDDLVEAIAEKVDSMIDEYKEDLIKSKQESDKVQAKAEGEAKESLNIDGNQLFEGWFTGKKGNIRNLTSQAIALRAQLESQKENEGIGSIITKLLGEVDKLIINLSELSTQKRKDIEESKLQEIGNRLNEIPLEITKKEEKLAKNNTANKEASAIYIQGLDIAENAFRMESDVKKEVSEKAAEEEAKKAEEEKENKRIKISGDLDPEKISGRRKNSEVAKFQEAVIEKFKDYKPFEDFDLFNKFKRYGADGMFGNTTKQIVVALKAGFGIDDTSDVITQELMDKIALDKLDESISGLQYISRFDSFENLMEKFDPDAAKRSSGGGSGRSGSTPKEEKDDSTDKEKEEKDNSADSEKEEKIDVSKVTEDIEKMLDDANKEIVKLYKNDEYWKPYKGFNDDEDEAVADTFGRKFSDPASWWSKNVVEPYIDKALEMLDSSGIRKEDAEVAEELKSEIDVFDKTYRKLKEKTYGSSVSDIYSWYLRKTDGTKLTYRVDTDF